MFRLHAEQAGWSPAEIARATTSAGRPVPRVDFVAEAECCPGCGGAVEVVKSRVRLVNTLAEGVFEAREVLKRCWSGVVCPVLRSEALARVVPPRQRFGYDLIVYVGLARYLGNKQRHEIWTEIVEQFGIALSSGTISYLCDRFLLYLEALHLTRAVALRAALAAGFALHIDATCEKGKGGLFVCMDGLRGWVLQAARITSECKEELRPHVERTVALFGLPLATMRDLGDAMAGAVEPLGKLGIPDLLCHTHFLGAVGKALFDQPYDRLRDILRDNELKGGLRALLRDLRRRQEPAFANPRFGPGQVREGLMALVLWILESDGTKNLAYPFALPHLDFIRRCRQAPQVLDRFLPWPRSEPECRAVRHLTCLLARLDRDPRIPDTERGLQERSQAFTDLRTVLRLTNAELPGSEACCRQLPLPAAELLRLRQIQDAVEKYTDELRKRVAATPKRGDTASPHAVVLQYLDRYGAKLFGHPAVRGPDGSVLAVVPRTNYPPEHLFGRDKQGLRRRLGRAHLACDLQQQPAQAALVHNLRYPDYVRVVCGSLENLPAAFATLDSAAVEQGTLVRDHRDSRLLRLIRNILKQDDGNSPTTHYDIRPHPTSLRTTVV